MDARVLSTKPLVAPAPLPHVSRRALRRVKNSIPDVPLGTRADKALREARKDAKALFFNALERNGIDRTEAYLRLA